ncbi:MAG: class I SAM-dependent methyltransferase [Cyclobacteriaceae bacterium]|nr:class I SAM-dependent methyltransferase [Cyclobacteriaceae bacterium]
MNPFSDEKIVDSWSKNITPWIRAINNNEIESRIGVTNRAILKEVINRKPKNVLDIGCGEGWLVHLLTEKGINTLGIDVTEQFISYAKKYRKGKYMLLSYKQLEEGLNGQLFDLIICNFSLIGKNSVNKMFKSISSLLNKRGSFIIQTLHPLLVNSENYVDGWREGSWQGFDKEFVDPAPWYFRTLSSWSSLFNANQLQLSSISEPKDENNNLASIIFVGTHNN